MAPLPRHYYARISVCGCYRLGDPVTDSWEAVTCAVCLRTRAEPGDEK
jgi:hypothetical protein